MIFTVSQGQPLPIKEIYDERQRSDGNNAARRLVGSFLNNGIFTRGEIFIVIIGGKVIMA